VKKNKGNTRKKGEVIAPIPSATRVLDQHERKRETFMLNLERQRTLEKTIRGFRRRAKGVVIRRGEE